MNFLALIPARGGSKGLPKKNIKKLNGIPLILHTVEAARQVFSDSDICVSTDSNTIKQVVESKDLAVPFLRPSHLATDDSSTYDVVMHALEYYKERNKLYDAVVILQPTSPFRNSTHIKEALRLFSLDLEMVVSVKETKSNPYFLLFEEDENGYLKKSKNGNYIRRQDCPKVWEYNGAIYVVNSSSIANRKFHELGKVKKYIMNQTSSIDIDSYLDFKLAEIIMKTKD